MDRDHEAVRDEIQRQLDTVREQREADRIHRKKIREMRETALYALVSAERSERLLSETGRELRE